jgi:PPOX class probable F420-dependent enzyme
MTRSAAVRLRRASAGDLEFLVELYDHPDVEQFLGARRARGREELLDEIERSQREPARFGRMIIEADGDRVGALGYHEVNQRSRIAHLEGLAVHPAFRGRRFADEAARAVQRYLIFELGYHRLELAVYGFNDRAIVHAERSGYVREGVKRKAYLRHGKWQDAIEFGLIREDLEDLDATTRRRRPMAKLNEKHVQLLLGKNFGNLAFLNGEGWPTVTPVWVDWDGENVLVNTLRARAKPGLVERDPRVEIAVMSSENPYQHVRVAGRAELVDEGAEEHIDKLSKKYVGEDSYPWRQPGDERVILRIKPERIADYGF